jgi:hypothetical protein
MNTNQGHRPDQTEGSYKAMFVALLVIVVIVLILIIKQ